MKELASIAADVPRPLGSWEQMSGHDVIGQVARRLGVTVATAPHGRLSAQGKDGVAPWAAWIQSAAALRGLTASIIELPVKEAADLAQAHGPLISFAPRSGVWVVLVGRSGDGIHVLEGDGFDVEATRDIGTLTTTLGAADQGASVPWAVLEPTLPLEALRGDGEHLPPHRRLLRLLQQERADLHVVIAYAVATGALSLAVPVAVQALVNTIAFGSMLQPVVVLTLLVLFALLFEGALRVLQASVVERLQERIFAKAAADVAERLARVRADVLRQAYAPELVNRFFDVITVQKAAAALLLDGVGLVLQTTLGLVLLAFYHPLLLAFDVVLVGVIAIILFAIGRGAVQTAVKESKAKYAVVSWLEEIGRHSTLFRTVPSRGFALGRVNDLVISYLACRRKHWKILLRQIIGIRLLFAVASATLLGFGGLLVIERQLTLGQLVAAELIVTAVLSGLSKFSKHLESYYDLAAAVDKLGQLVDLPLAEAGVGERPAPVGALAVEVRPGGDASTDQALKGRELRVPPGCQVALEGADDAARTALLEVLYGLQRPNGGAVLADGIDLRQLDLDAYRSHVALVRAGQVFEGTIEDNVRVGRDHLTAACIQEALRDVGLLDDILRMEHGLKTHVLAGGSPLSDEQMHRLALARAIVDRPRLLLIDHALDGFEDASHNNIVNTVLHANAPWTVVLATRRVDIARRCGTRHGGATPPRQEIREPAAGAVSSRVVLESQ